jgi:predicted ATPase/DNA-binding SARP family transcriptional activator
MQERADWAIHMFGGLRVTGPGIEIDRFPTKRAALLLARVALSRSGMIARDDLAGILWPDDFLDATRLRLRQELNRLKQGLGPAADIISADRSWVRLDLARTVVDAREFERSLSNVAADSPEVRRESRSRALELYAGPLLPEQIEDWVQAERHDLHAKLLAALIEQTEELIALGRAEDALASALRAVRADPYHEPARMAAIQAFEQLGDVGGAMRQYLEYEKALLREFGARPSDAMQRLVTTIRSNNRQQTTAPDPPTQRHTPMNPAPLPTYLDRVVGREQECRLAIDLLADAAHCRLLTITGPGGVGKTRVAVAAAAEIGKAITFVSLSDIESGRNVLGRIQEAFGATSASHSAEPIPGWGAKSGLLVVDNAEHVLDEVRFAVKQILLSHPNLSLLVTSRQRLGLGGEQELPLSPLAIPDLSRDASEFESSPSVELFLERARAVRPGYHVAPEESESLAMLLERLDGLPLAIELAAARIGLLTPEQMLGQIDDKFTFLVSRRSDVGPRQRSLRATVEWSFLGLGEELKSALASLASFHGGWTIELAQLMIAGPDTFELLQDLTERSLIHQEQTSQGSRFSMLETIRDYATSETPPQQVKEIRQRHARIVADHLFAASRSIVGADQARWYEVIRVEMDNARAALQWSVHEDRDTAAKLGAALWRFWCAKGAPSEGIYWLDRILSDIPEDANRDWAETCLGRGVVAENVGDDADRGQWFERAAQVFERLDMPASVSWALMNLALAKLDEGRVQESYEIGKRSLEHISDFNRPLTKNAMGRALAFLGRREEAMALAEQAFAARLNSADPAQCARAFYMLADSYVACGRYEGVHGLVTESVDRLRPLEIQDYLVSGLTSLAREELRLGNWEAFEAAWTEAYEMATQMSNDYAAMILMSLRGRRFATMGDAAACARAYEKAISAPSSAGTIAVTLLVAGMLGRDLARLGLIAGAQAVLSAESSLRQKVQCGRTKFEEDELEQTIAITGPPALIELNSRDELVAGVLSATIQIR